VEVWLEIVPAFKTSPLGFTEGSNIERVDVAISNKIVSFALYEISNRASAAFAGPDVQIIDAKFINGVMNALHLKRG
jgi:hypothetical protein